MAEERRYAVIAPRGNHWFAEHADQLASTLEHAGTVLRHDDHRAVPPVDIAFLLSYPRIVPAKALALNRVNVVAHASALPAGKGMSPLPWQILEGARAIPVTLFQAVPELDAGPVFLRSSIETRGNELLPELQAALARVIVDLCLEFARRYPAILDEAQPQVGPSTYYRRRSPADSELNPERSIAEQFDLLRIVDNEQYPAFFRYRKRTFRLQVQAVDTADEPE